MIHIYVTVCIYICAGRMDQESSGVTYASLLEGHQPVLQDDCTYSTIDDMQQKIPAVLVNPAYKFVKSFDNPKHGTAPTAAASAK